MKAEKIIRNDQGREFALDITIPEFPAPESGFPLLVFAHGFKGFKDWGHWYRLAEAFAAAGFAFLKFDYSMNGVRPGDHGNYSDLDAFGKNTFSQELRDWQTVLDWVEENGKDLNLCCRNIGLIGHSRSGPIALLTAAKDKRAGFAITWASVHSLDYAWTNPESLEQWKKEGVFHALNTRTGQQMPLYYSLFEDYNRSKDAFSLPQVLKDFRKPVLLVHGLADIPVPYEASMELKEIIPHARLELIPGADHVFGGHHPFGPEEMLPQQAQELMKVCLEFLHNLPYA